MKVPEFRRILGIAVLSSVLGLLSSVSAQKSRSPFDEEGGWRGAVNIAPGNYSPKHPIILGAKANPKDEGLQPASVTSSPGTAIKGADILIDEGTWESVGTHFKDCAIRIDLGGDFNAKRSLFENCALSKGGAWFVAWFSSKWSFDQCVFTGQFIAPIPVHDIGMKVTNCSFYDVDLSTVSYKTDAGTERSKDWMQVENCRFVHCKVPESFLLMTENCVFDGCTFGRADDSIPITTPVTMTVNLVNPGASKPKPGRNRVYEVIQGDLANAGASEVKYRRTGRNLAFD